MERRQRVRHDSERPSRAPRPTRSEARKWLLETRQRLQRLRDELLLQRKHGSMKYRDRMAELASKWTEFEQKADRVFRAVENEASETWRNLADELQDVARELEDGYRRIKVALSRD